MTSKPIVLRSTLVFLAIVAVGCPSDEQPTENLQSGLAPPVVSIVSPATSEILDTALVEIHATDDKGVVKVELYIDNIVIRTFITPPYEYAWDATGLSDSSVHLLYAKAYDADDNTSSSVVLVVAVFRFQPTGLIGTVTGDTTVILNWQDNSQKETGYQLERSVEPYPYEIIAYVAENTTSFLFSAPYIDPTNLSFRVRASSNGQLSRYSDPVNVTLPGSGGGGVGNPSFSDDIQPIFDSNCQNRGCHPGGGAPFSLDRFVSWSNIWFTPVTNQSCGMIYRVVGGVNGGAGNPDSSLLYLLVTGRTTCPRMPLSLDPGDTLSQFNQDMIRAWIEQGAQNN